MITPEQIYWITRADAIVAAALVLSLLSLIAFVVSAATMALRYDECGDRHVWPVIASGLFGIAMLLVSVFVPCTKDIAAMIIVPKVCNSELIQELPEGIIELTDRLLGCDSAKEHK